MTDDHQLNLVVEQTLAELTGMSPLRLLEIAGFAPEVADSIDWQYTMACPVCGRPLQILGDRVRRCAMESARLIDVLARRHGGNYHETGAMLEREIRGLRDKPRWHESGRLYCKNAQRLRWLALLARGLTRQADNPAIVQLASWAAKMEHEQLLEDGTAQLLDGVSVQSLYRTLGLVPVLRDNAIGLFYWLDDATPAAVKLVANSRKADSVEFFTFGAAVTGLHLPAHDTRIIHGTIGPVLQQRRGQRQDTWLVGSGVHGPGEAMVVLDNRSPTIWPAWGRLFAACPACRIRTANGDITRDDYAREELLKRTMLDTWPLLCSTIVECLEPSRECLDSVQTELRARGLMRAAAGLRSARMAATVWSDARWRLSRTPMGYIVQDLRTDDERQITNFCLDPLHNVVFAETSEVEHVLVMDLPGSTAEVRVQGADLQNPSKLQDALRMHAARTQSDGLPTVVDNSLCSKLLLPWLRRISASLDQRPGRAMLGWTADRAVFQSAGWRLTADSYQEAPVALKTSLPALACFDSTPQPSAPLPEQLPQPAQDLLAMVAALMARHHVRSKVRAVAVQNSGPARALCRALFRGFGQTRELELTTFRNTQSVPGIDGHPLLATGYNSAQAEACAIPAVFLTETGYSVQTFDEMFLPRITACARWTLQRVAEWLLSTDGREFAERPAFRWALGLMEEGAEIMRLACKLEAWEITAPELPALQKLVRLLQPEDTRGCFTLIDDTRMRITSPDEGPDARDLALELLLLGIPAACEGTTLTTQVVPFTMLLQDYWGRPPILSEGIATG